MIFKGDDIDLPTSTLRTLTFEEPPPRQNKSGKALPLFCASEHIKLSPTCTNGDRRLRLLLRGRLRETVYQQRCPTAIALRPSTSLEKCEILAHEAKSNFGWSPQAQRTFYEPAGNWCIEQI